MKMEAPPLVRGRQDVWTAQRLTNSPRSHFLLQVCRGPCLKCDLGQVTRIPRPPFYQVEGGVMSPFSLGVSAREWEGKEVPHHHHLPSHQA